MGDSVNQFWDVPLEETLEKLRRSVTGAVLDTRLFRGETTLVTGRESMNAVLAFLRADGFNYLVDVSSAHFPERGEIDLVYLVRDLKSRRQLRVKCSLPVEDPRIASACGVWAGANWMEREVYDLMGIVFEGHPDLRRILMPEDFDGFPLRKEYPMEGDDDWRNFMRPGEGE